MMCEEQTIAVRISEFGLKASNFSLSIIMAICLGVASFWGCTGVAVQVEKDAKPVMGKEEQTRQAPVPQRSRPPERTMDPREEPKKANEKEQLGREMERAVQEMRENVANLKKRLDDEVAENIATFKKDPPEYRIRPGDIIEIIYHMLYEENPAEYLLEIQDSVKIEFFNQPDLNRIVGIRSDGKITLPLIGDLSAAGLSTSQLEKELIIAYRRYLIDPIVTITLERFNVKIDELKKAITTAPRGQSKISPVRPDGRTSFPFIGDIKVGGMTVEEVRKIINEKYRQYIRNLEITVVIERVVNPTIFVMGEVNGPGDLVVTGPLYLSQVISRAKGLTPTADGKNVMVIRRYGVSKPVVFKADLDAVLNRGDISKDVLLNEDDTVYIPRGLRSRFFVVGEVNLAGVYPIFPDEQMTVAQAISMANGFRPTAALGSVMVLRRGEGQTPQVFQIDFTKVLNQGDLTQDVLIQKNDVIFVPKSFITKVDEFIDQWFTRGLYALFPANSILDFIIDLDTVRNINKRTYGF